MKHYEKTTMQLIEDCHGFPTFAVQHRHIRYNFCHLEDVFEFMWKVYKVDHDKLLTRQRGPSGVPAKKVVAVMKRMFNEKLHDFVLKLVGTHTEITAEEVQEYVAVEFEEKYTRKQVNNSLTFLLEKNQITSAGRGKYKKVLPGGISRELSNDGGTGTAEGPT